MHTLISWIAQYLLWIMLVPPAVIWLFVEDRSGKLVFAAQCVIAAVLGVALLYLAAAVHHDPRPFVQNPHITPYFSHARDDGFPSDHSIAAAVIAGVVFARNRLVGAVLALCAIAIAWARVAAHVHHLQDVVAGLVLGGLAAAVGVWLGPLAIDTFRRSTHSSGTRNMQ